MLLARGYARRHESAIRNSLGAGRFRLVGQFVIESLLLSLCGGLLGLVVARWMSEYLLRFLPQGPTHYTLDLRLDARSLLFTFLICIAAALLFGLTTAIQSTSGDLAAGVKNNPASSIESSSRARSILVVFQIAFSLALLAVAGMFIRTVFNLRPAIDYPQANRILTFTLNPQQEIYSPDRILTLVTETVRQISSLSGVQGTGIAESGPFASAASRDFVRVHGSLTMAA